MLQILGFAGEWTWSSYAWLLRSPNLKAEMVKFHGYVPKALAAAARSVRSVSSVNINNINHGPRVLERVFRELVA